MFNGLFSSQACSDALLGGGKDEGLEREEQGEVQFQSQGHDPADLQDVRSVRRPVVARRTGAIIIRISDDKLRFGLLNRPFPRVSKLVQFCRASLEMQRFVRPTRARWKRRRRL